MPELKLVATVAVKLRAPIPSLPARILCVFITFHLVCVGWVLFRSQGLDIALDYYQGLLRFSETATLATPFITARPSSELRPRCPNSTAPTSTPGAPLPAICVALQVR